MKTLCNYCYQDESLKQSTNMKVANYFSIFKEGHVRHRRDATFIWRGKCADIVR